MLADPHRCLVPLLDLSARADEATILATASRELATLLGGRASAMMIDEQVVTVAFSSHGSVAKGLRLSLTNYPELQQAMRDRHPVVIRDVQSSPDLAGVRERLPKALRSIIALPMVAGDSCVGALMTQSAQLFDAAPGQLEAADLLARLAGRLVLGARQAENAPVLTNQSLATGPVPVPRTQLLPPRTVGQPRHFLVVDDDPDWIATLRMVLLREDPRTHVVDVADGRDALAAIRHSPPDLVMLDLHLPGMDGLALADALKASERTREVPILFLSAADDLFTRMRNRRRGNVDFLSKPFLPDELLARVDRLLEYRDTRARLTDAANLDELTGLSNLRHLHERMAVEQSRYQRYATPLSIVMIDLDRLKRINDGFGHLAGNQALISVGKILQDTSRETDVSARYGGDEFVVVMPHAGPQHGVAFANRFLTRLRLISAPDGLPLAASVGIASTDPEQGTTLDVLLARADAAAYRAKKQGGNQVALFDPAVDGEMGR